MNEKNVLNILNGQSMYDYFEKDKINKNGIYVPFNEAMCVGDVTENIFSNEFNLCRCEALHITMEGYNQHFELLFENKLFDIFLWFDDDMFCQINLLTILAYLDQINYSRKITFNLVDRKNPGFKVVENFEIRVQGYHEIYKQVMINKCIPINSNLSIMENGIRLYLEYLKDENEITKYIQLIDKYRD